MQIKEIIANLRNSVEMNGNKIAALFDDFFEKLNFDSKEKLFESIITYYDSESNLNKIEYKNCVTENDRKLDLRVLEMECSAMRCFEPRESDNHYKISFDDNGKPISTVIYGTNGAGKSTLFDALEYTYLGLISELNARQIETPSKQEYLKFIERAENPDQLHCVVKTPSAELNAQNADCQNLAIAQNKTPHNNFIGPWRIAQFQIADFSATKNQSLEQIIASGMGMDKHIKVYSAVKELTLYKRAKEKKELRTIVDKLDESSKLINMWQSEIATLNSQLKSSIPNCIDVKMSTDTAHRMLEVIEYLEPLESNHEEVFAAMREFLLRFHKFQESQISEREQKQHKMLLSVKEFLNENTDKCPVCETEINPENVSAKLDEKLYGMKECVATVNNLKDSFVAMTSHIKDSKIRIEEQLSSIKHIASLLSQNAAFKHIFETTRQYQDHLQKILDEELLDSIIVGSGTPSIENYTTAHRTLYYEYEVIVKHIEQFNSMTSSIEALITEQSIHLRSMFGKEIAENRTDSTKFIENKLLLRQGQVDEEFAKIETLQKSAAIANAKVEHQKKVFAQIQTYAPLLELEIKQHIANNFKPLKEFLKQVIDIFLEPDDLQLQIDCNIDAAYSPNDSAKSISITLVNKTTQEAINPSKFFNTFRYKLFCSMVPCALALSQRQESELNLPIVIDDPFFGFDTQNKEIMHSFIEKIYRVFEKFNSIEKPLQLIIFTHDWQLFKIFESNLSRKGVKCVTIDSIMEI